MMGADAIRCQRGSNPPASGISFNPSQANTNILLSGENRTAETTISSYHARAFCDTPASGGVLVYCEFNPVFIGGTGSGFALGVGDTAEPFTTSRQLGRDAGCACYRSDGRAIIAGSAKSGLATYTSSDRIGIAVDTGVGSIEFFKNGISVASYPLTIQGDVVAACSFFAVGEKTTIHSTSSDVIYPPPLGYTYWGDLI